MASVINILQHQLEVTEVGDVQVSEITEDETVGGFVRTIDIYNESVNAAAPTLMVQLKIRSITETNLHVTVPENEF